MAGKKALSLPVEQRKEWIDSSDGTFSLRRQYRLAGLSRSNHYYEPISESEENLKLMRLIDQQYMKYPFYGYPRMTDWLQSQGYEVNHKRVARLMKKMDLQAITPGPHTSKPAKGHEIYPYLLRGVEIVRKSQVWSMDITYIPMKKGYLYLAAIIDWFSRYVIDWELSNSMDREFCMRSLKRALTGRNKPEIFNTDQGSQFTSSEFTTLLKEHQIAISMDGKGRAVDNIFIERLWWSLKYENIYPSAYESGDSLKKGLQKYFHYYNHERKHSSISKRVPAELFEN